MRKEFAHPRAVFAVLGELVFAVDDRVNLVPVGETGEAPFLFYELENVLAMVLGKGWLGIKKIHLRGAARLEKIDDALGTRRIVRCLADRRLGVCRAGTLHSGKGDAAQSGCAELEHAAAADVAESCFQFAHGLLAGEGFAEIENDDTNICERGELARS